MRAPKLTGWRRIATAIWSAPNDPQIYGAIELDARPLTAFIEAAQAHGHHLTPTHLVGRALALALARSPDLNVRLAFGRAIPHDTVDIFFITAVAGGHDLSGVKVERSDQKSAIELASELEQRSRNMKAGRDPDFKRTKDLLERLPIRVLRQALKFSAFVSGDLERSIRALSIKPRAFGSAVVSSVGMLGLPAAFIPLSWLYRVPLAILVGEITDKPVAREGRLEICPMIPISATIDHRYVDGWHISQLLQHFRDYLADPSAHEPAF